MSNSFIPVLLGGDQNVYGMARTIYEEYKIRSVSIAKRAFPVVHNSKILDAKVVKDFDTSEVFVSALKELRKTLPDKAVLISCGDNYTRLLSKHKVDLEEDYLFCVPDECLIDKLCTKEGFYKTCDEYGFKYPQTDYCRSEDKDSYKTSLSYPLIVKASNSVAYWNCSFEGKKKVFLAQDEKELKAIIDAVYSSSYKDPLIIQEYIPGSDDNMRVVNAYCKKGGGVSLMSLGHIILEEHTAQGIGSYAAIMGCKDEKLCDKIKSFLEDIKYEGFINIDIKLDPRNGEYNFFEINPRQGRSSYFVTAGGANLAKFIISDLVEKAPIPYTCHEAHCVWSIVPKGIIFKYVKDKAVLSEIRSQIGEGGFIKHLNFKADMTLKKRIGFYLNQLHYYKKYRENFNRKGFFE